MAAITAALVKELREKSGAGMMDCKKALVECDGDLEGAVDWLRKKGPGRGRQEGRAGGGRGAWSVSPPTVPAVLWSRSMPRPISSPATRPFRISCAAVPSWPSMPAAMSMP